jgi:outer membrane protein assembly factor BamB
MMNAQGKYLNSIKAGDGKFAWRAEVRGNGIGEDSQVFSPPALGERNLYLCGAQGHIVAVNQKDGALAFAYALKQPMAFQPALAKGSIYAGTVNGLLICLKTGDKDADGWYAWGGNAQHNKQ